MQDSTAQVRTDLAHRIATAVVAGETPDAAEVAHYADLTAQLLAESVDLDAWIAERVTS